MKKINQIGYAGFHRFRFPDASFVDVEVSDAEFEELAKLNHKTPELAGAVWEYSYERFKFDTPDGRMGDDQYADVVDKNGMSCQVVKISSNVEIPFLNPVVVDGVLDSQKVAAEITVLK